MVVRGVLERVWLALLAGAALVGCDAAPPVYQEASGTYLAASITPRSQWKVSGAVSNPAAAVDNDLHTAALTGPDYIGAAAVVDLGKPCSFQTVIIDHGVNEMGFARQVELASSLDGQNYQHEYSTAGARRVTIICLPKPILARYIRLVAEAPGTQPWSLAEIYVQ